MKKILLLATNLLLFGVIAYVISLGYKIDYFGFGAHTLPDGTYVPAKTVWDWLQLLYVPILGAITATLTRVTARIADDRQQDAILREYFDRMTELLLREKLRTTKKIDVRNVARSRTLTLFSVLDGKRKVLAFVFLYEAGLITGKKPIINLKGADLSDINLENEMMRGAQLQGANLRGANLRNVTLSLQFILNGIDKYEISLENTNLEDTNLSGAKLGGVNFERSILKGANLSGAILRGAYLPDVDLRTANLRGADLEQAYLAGAKVTPRQIVSMKSLKDAIMPDGTEHE